MSLGENIQMLRMQQGMSREALGHALSLSGQTVDLWETGQTVPTVDELIRLKELFGVSMDDIVSGSKEAVQPDEVYAFSYTEEELLELGRLQLKASTRRLWLLGAALLLFTGSLAFSALADAAAVAAFFSVLWIIRLVKSRAAWKRSMEKSAKRASESLYRYEVFEDRLNVRLFRNGEETRFLRIPFEDIDSLHLLGNYLLLENQNLSYPLRKDALASDSRLLLLYYTRKEERIPKKPEGKQQVISLLLFFAALLSLPAGMALSVFLSRGDSMPHFWGFFLFLPVSLACYFYGRHLKKKNISGKKNILAGEIVSILLLVYGSFIF